MSFRFLSTLFSLIYIFQGTNAYAIENVSWYWTGSMYGTPTVYEVNPTEFKFCETFDVTTGLCTGDNDYTFVKTMSTPNCNIAAAAAGEIACQYGDTGGATPGVTYNFAWMRLSRTMSLAGSVTNTDSSYPGEMTTCVTSSARTNTNGTGPATGASSGVPSTQNIYFLNGVGNDTYQGNASSTVGSARGNSLDYCDNNDAELRPNCIWTNISILDDAGYVATSSSNVGLGGGQYGYTTDFSAPWGNGESDKIWQEGLTSSDTDFILIYKLTTPYTIKKGIDPLVKMTFDVTGSLRSQFSRYLNSDESPPVATEFCTLDVGNPSVTFTVSDN